MNDRLQLVDPPSQIPCTRCGGTYAIGDWPLCNGDPSQHARPSGGFFLGNAKKAPETVIFRDRRGQIIIPGTNQDPTPAGCRREEISGVFETRKLQKELDRQSRDQHEMAQERNEPINEFRRKQRQSELRRKMSQMSPAGRDFARVAIEKSNAKARKRYDPGNHVVAYEQNNPSHNSEATGWKDKR